MRWLSRGFVGLAAFSMLMGLFVSGVSVGAADADRGHSYEAILQSGNAVPASDEGAAGVVWLHINDDQSVAWSVYFWNISNPMKGLIQLGRQGENGPVVDTLWDSATTGPFIGTFSGTMASGTMTSNGFSGPWQGKSMDNFFAAVKSGNAYINFTSAKSPNGVARGQITSDEIRDLNSGTH